MFSILKTSLTDKPLILQWEVWLISLLGLKGLSTWDLDSAPPCCCFFLSCWRACSCWICSSDLTGWLAAGGRSPHPGIARACCSRCCACSCCSCSSRRCRSLSSCCWICAKDIAACTWWLAPHRDPPLTYVDGCSGHSQSYNTLSSY